MAKKPTQTEINEALQKICKHALFVNSPQNTRLLSYLVEQAIKGNKIKEHVIGLDVFPDSYSLEKNDGSVRVYMYKLRKKLEKYYALESKHTTLVFEIKKGQYNLSFSDIKNYDASKKASKKSIEIPLKQLYFWAIILFLLASFAFFYTHLFPKNNYCWNAFFSGKEKNLCLVADHFVTMNKDQNNFSISNEINNQNEFIVYANKHNEAHFEIADFTLFTKMAPFTIQTLTAWFYDNRSDFLLKTDSDFKYEESREKNILYVGQFKTMKESKSIFLKNSKKFKINKDGFSYIESGGIKNYTTTFNQSNKTEYALVSFEKTSNNKEALFFVSNHDIGVLATVRNFTDRNWLENFYKNLPTKTSHFNALFEVHGIQRTDMNCKLVQLEILD
ncbi:helix-turn-helix domain-containing protein [Flavicella sediminum]|uniref:helix-turn-helix domain-containing protein n=1 Tax=Flavicella sediminum TaxID=2585141 RepID=UPI00111E9BF6|nr:helix-turn-helix domain-containing protein [Flavicella sediminum]